MLGRVQSSNTRGSASLLLGSFRKAVLECLQILARPGMPYLVSVEWRVCV
jgi:hypothetical protein